MIQGATDIPTWMSIAFTALCCLVTTLVAWQISQSINLDRKMRKMERIITHRINDYDGHFTAAVCLAMGKMSANSHEIIAAMGRRSDALNAALDHIAQAFENINECPIKGNVPAAYEALASTLSIIEKQLDLLADIKPITIQRVLKAVMQDSSNNASVDKIAILNRILEIRRYLEALHN